MAASSASLVNMRCFFNGTPFEVTVHRNDSYQALKQKCLETARMRRIIFGGGNDQNYYKVLLEPRDDAVSGLISWETADLYLIETSSLTAKLLSDAVDVPALVDEYEVKFQHVIKRIRAEDVDSLKTFFEKMHDAFGEDFVVDKVIKVYQEVNNTYHYLYNVDDPTNRNLRKTMEHVQSDIHFGQPLIVILGAADTSGFNSSEDVERDQVYLHFSLGDGIYKQIEYNSDLKLAGILEALNIKEDEEHDLRVKARSVYNKANGVAKRSKDVTVKECGLTGGDVIEVVHIDLLSTSFACTLMTEGAKRGPYSVSVKSGCDIRELKKNILEEFDQHVLPEDPLILFESIEQDGLEYYRALYNMEELSATVNEDIKLVLWAKCEYIEIKRKQIERRRFDFEWPWGNKEYDSWTWGLVVSLKNTKDPPHYFVRTIDNERRYINVRTGDVLNSVSRTAHIPGTQIAEKTPRKISMFIAFIKPTTILVDFRSDKKILKYTRNTHNTLRLQNDQNEQQFWNPNASVAM